MREMLYKDADKYYLPCALRIQNPDFTVRIVCSRIIYTEDEYLRTEQHIHDFCEMHYVTEGQTEIRTEVGRFNVGKGSFIIYAPFIRHRNVSVARGTVKYGFAFYIDNVSPKYEHVRSKLISEGAGVYTGGNRSDLLISLMRSYMEQGVPVDNEILLKLMEFFLINIFEQIKDTNLRPAANESLKMRVIERDSYQPVILNMKKYISLNADRTITVEEVSKAVGFCPRHLNRIARKYSGCGVKDIITDARKEYIERLLSDRTLSLSSVARLSGFTKSSTMSVFYKRITGLSPTEYRKSALKR